MCHLLERQKLDNIGVNDNTYSRISSNISPIKHLTIKKRVPQAYKDSKIIHYIVMLLKPMLKVTQSDWLHC